LLLAAAVACGVADQAPSGAPATAVSSGSTPVAPAPIDALDALDRRAPVPLLPMMANHQKQNMRDHLVAIREIVGAVAAQDFDAVERSASRIGYSEQMGNMCSHMGAGAPGFTDQALKFHHSADEIGAAARKRDPRAVLDALDATLATCTDCHATYKQKVVDEASWTEFAGEAPPPHQDPNESGK
jgi:hypothetical protein